MQQNLEHSSAVISSQAIYESGEIVSPNNSEELRLDGAIQPLQLDSREHLSQTTQKRRSLRVAHARWRLSLMIGDGILLVSLFLLELLLQPSRHFKWQIFRHEGVWNTSLLYVSLGIITWIFATKVTQAYTISTSSNRFTSALKVLFAISLALVVWTLLLASLADVTIASSFKHVVLFFLLSAPVLAIWRVLFAECMNMPIFRRNAVIVGKIGAGEIFAKELRNAKRPYVTLLGYISESDAVQTAEDDIPVLGGQEMLRRLGESGSIDTVISAIDYRKDADLFQEIITMSYSGISVIPMPIAYEMASGKIPVEHVGDQWYLSLPVEVVVSPLYLFWRKMLDVISGLVGTAILLLLLPIVALVIRLDSPGPIFYSQERLGIKGKPFRIYKFRSMYVNAEQTGQAQWAQVNDARVTRIGRIMRVTHMDELPQMWNILRGDMSFIGPRPERGQFVSILEKTIPFYRYRLAVKPGLTGWAQVKYRYGNSDNDALAKLQYDLYYIKHQAFMLDIFIILMTCIEMLFCRGT